MSRKPSTKELEAELHSETQDLHIEKTYYETSGTVVMFCGLVANILNNGSVDPPQVDFYLLGSGHEKATCQACKWEAAK